MLLHHLWRQRQSAPSLACGEGWGVGVHQQTPAQVKTFPHPPRSDERVDLPRKRER